MRGRIFWFIALAAVGGAAAVAWQTEHKPATAALQSTSAPSAVPVTADVVQKQDVAIYLGGLGSVQAFNTVTVKARVDGTLEKLAFTEGQEVKEGDLLAQVDSRPYQAQLAQVQAA